MPVRLRVDRGARRNRVGADRSVPFPPAIAQLEGPVGDAYPPTPPLVVLLIAHNDRYSSLNVRTGSRLRQALEGVECLRQTQHLLRRTFRSPRPLADTIYRNHDRQVARTESEALHI